MVMKGVRLGFVTDSAQKVEGVMIQKIVRLCSIFDDPIIVTGEMTGSLKKDHKPFHELIKLAGKIGVSDDQIIFVGDTPSADIDGPFGTAIKTILIIYDNQQTHSGEMQPWRAIKNLMEVVNLLPEISKS